MSTNLPSLSKDKPFTNRERLAVHLNNEGCSSCHSLIDPIGFGFEKFDAIGQYREKLHLTFPPDRKEKDGKTQTADLPLNTEGDVAGIKDSHFSSPRGLGKILAGSDRCQECVVKQLFRYAAGRKETAADRAIIQRSYEAFRDSKFRFQDLMVALVKSIEFPSGVAEETNVSGSH